MKTTRRELLKYLGSLAALLGLPKSVGKAYAETLRKLKEGKTKIIIISGQACSGCILSATYSDGPFFDDLVIMIKNILHPTLAASQGKNFIKELYKVIDEGDYILTTEGAVPGEEKYCEFGGKPYSEILLDAVRNAKFLVNMGTCASYGGVPAAKGNPTKAMSVPEFLKKNGVNIPYVNVPGCPVRSDRILATWLYIATFDKLPPINQKINAPKMFYEDIIHYNCERYQYFTQDIYAKKPGDKFKCLLALGCRGPITYGDCSYKRWNCGKNYCIAAGTPCIGCSNPKFPFDKPIYTSPQEVLKGLKIQ